MGVEQSSSPKSTASFRSNASSVRGSAGGFKINPGMSPKMNLVVQRIFSNKRAMSPANNNANTRMRRSMSTGSAATENEWGFFEDFEPPSNNGGGDSSFQRSSDEFEDAGRDGRQLMRALSLPPPATQPPMYVLESTLATQQLWYATAGQRPKQPQQEREYFEQLWRRNFELSAVQYKDEKAVEIVVTTVPHAPAPSAPSSSSSCSGNPPSACTSETGGLDTLSPTTTAVKTKGKLQIRDEVPYKEFDGEILYRGKGPFSNSVSKSFPDDDVSAMTLQVPRFRIVRASDGEVHAEFLIVISINSHSPFTFGLWRRHSDFNKLAMKVQSLDLKSGLTNSYKNALLSWQCLIHRKRWFRCLDKDYLSLKCFLLERFMHDLLFESHSPVLISEFLGLI